MHALLYSVPPTLHQATTDPRLHQRLQDTHRQVWVSLLWGHCSFLLGPGAHKVMFVPSKSLFPQSCVSTDGSVVGFGDLLQEGMPYPGLLHPEPLPLSSPLLTGTSSGDTQTQFCLSLCRVSGSRCAQGMFEHSEGLWWVWGFLLNRILPPPTFLLGLFCPWTWDISSQPLQDHAVTAPALCSPVSISVVECSTTKLYPL